MTSKYMTSKQRRRSIVEAALAEAESHGYAHVTREQIAQRAQCAPSLVTLHLGTMVELRRAVMSEAVRARNLRVIAQGIVDDQPKVKRLDDDVKRAAMATFIPGV